MARDSEAESVKIRVDPAKEFVVTLTGEQIKFLIQLISANSYPGNKVFLVGDTLNAIQKPLLDDAHGASWAPNGDIGLGTRVHESDAT